MQLSCVFSGLVGNIYRVNNHEVVWRTFLGGNVSRSILNVLPFRDGNHAGSVHCVENVSGRRCIIKSAEFSSILMY